jgi:hypothetical protein
LTDFMEYGAYWSAAHVLLSARVKPFEAEHRQHAVVELFIRDLKDQALAHFPCGRFFANAAWSVIGRLTHKLLRWTGVLGLPGDTVRTARTLRRRLLHLPGRLTHSARPLDAPPPRPLALAAPLHRGAHPRTGARSRRLSSQHPTRPAPPHGALGNAATRAAEPSINSGPPLAGTRTTARRGRPRLSPPTAATRGQTQADRWIEAEVSPNP